jgi:2-C-methyl-D-erythritol 4-phosphate cytidylyltransferase
VVPAAGIGARMGAGLPKQYLTLAGQSIIAHTLARLGDHPLVAGLYVAVAAEDPYWSGVSLPAGCPVARVDGGAERCHSVLNALEALAAEAGPEDWVLVHDAARPCLRWSDIDALAAAAALHPAGGLLGLPVRDTMKRTDGEGAVVETVSRERLWHALTPQMFRLSPLRSALAAVLEAGGLVTDEAQAMERAGHRPLMVEGRADNIKVTRPGDLALAELFLEQQAREGEGRTDPAPRCY